MKTTIDIQPIYSVYLPHGPACRDVFHAISRRQFVWESLWPLGTRVGNILDCHPKAGLGWPWEMARSQWRDAR